MKNMLWRLVRMIFADHIQELLTQSNARYLDEMRPKEAIASAQFNYPLGWKVIVRSNEPEPLRVGHVVDHKRCGITNNSLLFGVKDEATGSVFYTMVHPAHWSAARESALRKLDWAEQYNVMSKYDTISRECQLEKESSDYLNRKGCRCIQVHTESCIKQLS
jgi:hypothetical protein